MYYDNLKDEHLNEHHSDENGKIKCPNCDVKLQNLKEMHYHIRKDHEFDPCTICGEMIGNVSWVVDFQL